MVNYLKGKNQPTSDLEDDVESDCDGGPPGANNESQTIEGEEGEETRAVLTVGSFSACVHFFPPTLSQEESRIPQLEISVLLPLHK